MDAFELSARIGDYVARKHPRIRYFTADVEAARKKYSEEELAEMEALGLTGDGFETYYVVREFLAECGATELADGGYLLALFREAKRLDAVEFRENPYIRAVTVPTVRRGRILLTTAEYRRGEILQYAMPDFAARTVVPRLGFFDRTVRFPTVYEGDTPWMSVCPSEISSMQEPIAAAHGRVLVLGLGLGYYPFMIAEKDDVEEITVVELQEDVIALFTEHLLPQFPGREKLRIVQGDAVAFLDGVTDGTYDFCFADIWEGAVDGAIPYQRIKAHEPRLPSTEFAYWIEPQIRAYLAEAE